MMSRGGGDSGGSDSGNILMNLIPNSCPKPDLFLYKRDPDSNPIDVTNYKIDDLLNLNEQEGHGFDIKCLYQSPDLNPIIVNDIMFGIDGDIFFSISTISDGMITTNEVTYNNKLYYYYRIQKI